jgi:hypothetical protein
MSVASPRKTIHGPSRRWRRAAPLAAGLAILLSGMSAEARGTKGLDAFLAAYQCPVFAALEQIRARPMTPLNRFLTLSVGSGQRYVQCIYEGDDTVLHCEAASGFYGKPPGQPSKASLRAIAALGFDMDGSQGNFVRHLPVRDQTDVWNVAGLMLETLYRGYGARVKNRITKKAPFSPGPVLSRSDGSCLNVS